MEKKEFASSLGPTGVCDSPEGGWHWMQRKVTEWGIQPLLIVWICLKAEGNRHDFVLLLGSGLKCGKQIRLWSCLSVPDTAGNELRREHCQFWTTTLMSEGSHLNQL